jgi:hypothetical protein
VREPFRLLADVSGDPLWTVVAEADVGSADECFALERTLHGARRFGRQWLSCHDIVTSGRREISRVEG